MVYALNQLSIYVAVFPVARILGARKEEVEMGVTLLMFTPGDPLAEYFLPVSRTSLPKDGVFPSGFALIIPLKWKLRLPPSHFWLLLPLNLQA